MSNDIHDTIPSPPPTEPPDTIRDNEITDVDNHVLDPSEIEHDVVVINQINFNIPLVMLIISAAATLLFMFYCCH